MTRNEQSSALAQGSSTVEYRNFRVGDRHQARAPRQPAPTAGRDGGHLARSGRADDDDPDRGSGARARRALRAVAPEEPARGPVSRRRPRTRPRLLPRIPRPDDPQHRTGRAAAAASAARRDPGAGGRADVRSEGPDPDLRQGREGRQSDRGRGRSDRAFAAQRAALADGRGVPRIPHGPDALAGRRREIGRDDLRLPPRGQDDERRQSRRGPRPSSAGASCSSTPTSTSRASTRSSRSRTGSGWSRSSPKASSRRAPS